MNVENEIIKAILEMEEKRMKTYKKKNNPKAFELNAFILKLKRLLVTD